MGRSTTSTTSGGDRTAPNHVPDQAPNHVPEHDPKPPVAPRRPAGTDDAGRHDVQEPTPKAPRQTTSLASMLLGQDTTVTRDSDRTEAPAPPPRTGAGDLPLQPRTIGRDETDLPLAPRNGTGPDPLPPHQQSIAPTVPVPLANSLTELRPNPATRRVEPLAYLRIEGAPAPPPVRPYEVRRGQLLNGDPVTELVLRLHLDHRGVPQDQAGRVTALRERVGLAVNDAYNGGHRLPDGSRLQVRVEFADSAADADHTVRVHRGTVRQDEANWGLRAGREVIGHELGRVLGLHDGPRELHRAPGADRTVVDWPRRLRTVGDTVDEAFAPEHTEHTTVAAANPRRITGQVRDTALYGPDGETGTGGTLLRPSVDEAFPGQLRTNPNDTVRLSAPAGSGGQARTFFPRHWTVDEITYAVEQAHLDSRRFGTDDSSPVWTGEYAGVTITGTQRDGVVTGFRPHHDQGDATPPPYAPHRPGPRRAADLDLSAGFGDRRTLTPLHHAVDPATGAAHGVRTETVGAPHQNGTRRAHTWYLDPSVPPDSPLADFPGRWHRSSDGPAARLYPEHWTRQRTEDTVPSALLDGRPRREAAMPDGRTRHVVTEVDGVWVEGLVRDGQVLVHRPTERQPEFTPGFVRRWDDAPVLAHSEPVTRPVTEGGPELTARRVVFATGQEGIELTVRLHLTPGEGMTGPDLAAYRRRLQESADDLVANEDLFTPVSLRLEFTEDPAGTFTSVRVPAGRPAALDEHLRPLLAVVDEHGLETAAAILAPAPGAARHALPLPEPVAGALRPPGAEDPSAPSASTDRMRGRLTAMREVFTDAAWERPAQGVPSGWTAADARYAAYRTLRGGLADEQGLVWAEYAGRTVVVQAENGLITRFQIDAVRGEDGSAPPSGTHRVLATAEVRPPADAFRHSLAARFVQSFEATRIALPGGDTETVLGLRIHLGTGELSGLPPAEREAGLRALRARAVEGVDEQFNRGQRLPNGDLLRVEVTFVDSPGEAHHTVELYPDHPRANALNWDLGLHRSTIAHELGHLLGLPDEYREAGRPPRPVYGDGALMSAQVADRFGRFRVDHDNSAGGVAPHPAQGLPARYLRELGSVVDEAFGPAGGPVGRRVVPGGPPARARFGEDTLRTVLHGDRDGSGDTCTRGRVRTRPGCGRPWGRTTPTGPSGSRGPSRCRCGTWSRPATSWWAPPTGPAPRPAPCSPGTGRPTTPSTRPSRRTTARCAPAG